MVDQTPKIQTPKWRVSESLRENAKAMRRDMTDAEPIIWYKVRAHRFRGASCRRQTPIGPYVVDFVCHAARLIIELDGGQHFESGNMVRDKRRDSYLAAQGYRVLRFNNHEVVTNKAGVLETIAEAIGRAPSLALPRKRGRGQGSADPRGSALLKRRAHGKE
jgi:very-short-patch-repair endonuclease